jgi:hypothetical protein
MSTATEKPTSNKVKKPEVKLTEAQEKIAAAIIAAQVKNLKDSGITDRTLAKAMGFSQKAIDEVLPKLTGMAGKSGAALYAHQTLLFNRATVRYAIACEEGRKRVTDAWNAMSEEERKARQEEKAAFDKAYADNTGFADRRAYAFKKEPGEVERARAERKRTADKAAEEDAKSDTTTTTTTGDKKG